MLDKLHIRNFLTFDELLVEDLKRVNLIAGQNNSGKTALLEAIRVLESNGDSTVVNNILESRGVFIIGKNNIYDHLFNRNILKNGFENGKNSVGKDKRIEINKLIINRTDKHLIEYQVFFKNDAIFTRLNASLSSEYPNDKITYVSYKQNNSRLEELWSNIALTPKEDAILNIFQKSINSNIERINISNDNARVKLKDSTIPIPMGTMGDGINRILLIALSLANAENNILLIDEIEMGLHHTVIEKLWKLIFKYAKLWDIQVFVTTHSQDVLRTFYYVASEKGNEGDGKYFRLQKNRADEMEAVALTMDELELSLDVNLEIR